MVDVVIWVGIIVTWTCFVVFVLGEIRYRWIDWMLR